MLVGALCDLGVRPSALEWELGQVNLGEFHMHFERVTEDGLTGVRFSIHEGAVHRPEQDEGKAAEKAHEPKHGDGGCGHDHDHDDHDADAGHPVDPLIVSIEASGLDDAVKVRVLSILKRLGQTHDALTLLEAASVICSCVALQSIKPERVAFFCRQGTMDSTIDSGSAIAAEFVSSSAPLPEVPCIRSGQGLGTDGELMRAVLCEPLN